jgi:hypothetical protein
VATTLETFRKRNTATSISHDDPQNRQSGRAVADVATFDPQHIPPFCARLPIQIRQFAPIQSMPGTLCDRCHAAFRCVTARDSGGHLCEDVVQRGLQGRWPVISLKNDRTPTVLARTWRGTLQAHLPSGRAILVPPLLMSTTFPDGSVDHIPISVTQ